MRGHCAEQETGGQEGLMLMPPFPPAPEMTRTSTAGVMTLAVTGRSWVSSRPARIKKDGRHPRARQQVCLAFLYSAAAFVYVAGEILDQLL